MTDQQHLHPKCNLSGWTLKWYQANCIRLLETVTHDEHGHVRHLILVLYESHRMIDDYRYCFTYLKVSQGWLWIRRETFCHSIYSCLVKEVHQFIMCLQNNVKVVIIFILVWQQAGFILLWCTYSYTYSKDNYITRNISHVTSKVWTKALLYQLA